MHHYLFLLLFLFLLGFPSPLHANNLRIENVSLEDRDSTNDTAIVEFDISWDNSWRNSENYDAVWVVVKVLVGGDWVHGHLDASGINPADTSPGTNTELNVDVPIDYYDNNAQQYLGAYIYRRGSGTGHVSSKDVRLKLDYGTTATRNSVTIGDTTSITVRVVGLEMVYIPEGAFYAGDTTSTAAFRHNSSSTNPWYIQSEATIRTVSGATGSYRYVAVGYAGEFATADLFTIPDYFPKGYAAFYCMKYEATEGDWVTFFNTLNSTQKTNMDITGSHALYGGKGTDTIALRNTITWTSGDATSTRPDRAVNYVGWTDVAAYLDWMALRPMTELEYEKSGRGPVRAVANEYAWGTTSITAGVTFNTSPETGNEIFTTANANAVTNATTFSQGDDYICGAHCAWGPTRVGIFATSNSTRIKSGAGYYGVMDLTGNVYERTVTVGNTTGITFYPVHGDGILSSLSSYEGQARQLGWPGTVMKGGDRGVSWATGSGYRGGAWGTTDNTERTLSSRTYAAIADEFRDTDRGIRGVRSATPITTVPDCGDNTVTYPEQCDGTDTTNCTNAGGSGCTSQCECQY